MSFNWYDDLTMKKFSLKNYRFSVEFFRHGI
jgi:hypothetical protein